MSTLYIAVPDGDEHRQLAAVEALRTAQLPVSRTWLDPRTPDQLVTRRPHAAWKWAATTSFAVGIGCLLAWIWTDTSDWAWTGLVAASTAFVLALVAMPGTPKPTGAAPGSE